MPDHPPPYRQHESAIDRMSPEERLRSLQEYAEQQKYVTPGDAGTLNTSPQGVGALVFGGPMLSSTYNKPLPPPEYPAGAEASSQPRRKSAVGRWLDRRRQSKDDGSANPETIASSSKHS